LQAADLSKPIDKKLYKGTNPSCHDFNQTTSTNEGAPLLVGFTTGQIQLIYPGRKEQGKLFNEEVRFFFLNHQKLFNLMLITLKSFIEIN
jgi:hypothetical protein